MKRTIVSVLLLISLVLGMTVTPANAAQMQTTSSLTALQLGGDRLVTLQNNDGGWDWELSDGDPTKGTAPNTIGPIAMGLAKAYEKTGSNSQLAALEKSGDFLLAKRTNFSPSDGYLAAELDKVFGGTEYCDSVNTYYYGPLADGTYNRKGLGTLYSTESLINLIQSNRSSTPNMAAWDIGMGLVGAVSCGADTTAWIAGVETEINKLDSALDYDVIGLAGVVYGLSYAGVDFDPTAGSHAAAASVDDLAEILASYQIENGGFAWNSSYVIPNDGNETIQETAYAIFALSSVNSEKYFSVIKGAADYLTNVQMTSGGWKYYSSYASENNEVTAEALWALGIASQPVSLYVCTTGNCGHPGAQFTSLQAAIDAAPAYSTINVESPATFAEDIVITTPGLTLKLNGVTIAPHSPCFEISADDVTISGSSFCTPTDGSAGVVVNNRVKRLVIQGMEITGGTAAGISLGTGLEDIKILDNNIHGNAAGIELAGAVAGTFEIQGNRLDNTLDISSAVAVNAEWNSFASAAPETIANTDNDPYTYAKLSVVPAADSKVLEFNQVTYLVKLDAVNLTGIDFVVTYDETALGALNVVDKGLFDQYPTLDTATPGEIHFFGVSSSALNTTGSDVLEITFEAKATDDILNLTIGVDDASDQYGMAPDYGSSTMIIGETPVDAELTVYPVFDVTGLIDLQGRTNDSGAALTFAKTVAFGPYLGTSDSWGHLLLSGVVEDTYSITVVRDQYLDVTADLSKSVLINKLKLSLNKLVLIAGDVSGDLGVEDNVIDVNDVTYIGGRYNTTGAAQGKADLTGDGFVNIYDLSLVGGNYMKTSASAYGSWIP